MSRALTPSQEWWTAEEIAAAGLPDLPASKRGLNLLADRQNWRADPAHARRRDGRGGGWEYSWQLLPERARRRLLTEASVAVAAPVPAKMGRDEAWAWYEKLPQSVKAKAEARLKIISTVEAVEQISLQGRHLAIITVSRTSSIGARTIWSWFEMIAGVRLDDRLPYLAPRNRAQADRARAKECDPDFFDVLKSMYLRFTGPTFADCYRDALKIARAKGWSVLPERTMRRHLDKAVSKLTQVLTREGVEALKRLYPPQVRDKTAMSAMEAVNADFHKFDVFVRWPAPFGQNVPGIITRPQMVCFQDIYSGRILAWRVDQTPNSTAVQLCAGDMIETYGIPKHVLFDNGREFAAKFLTGGASTRFRFKIKEDDPQGIFNKLGCEIHWATPYHGQAKPIERAFRDMCSSIAKDVRFDGAYTGNTPLAKPEDYGSKAIDLEYFLKVLGERIAEHNARQNRRSAVAFGRSFVDAFDESYAVAPIRKATEAQRRMWLMGAEDLKADKNSGAVWFQGNEFWGAWMHEIADQRVIARFDPADFRAGLHIYSHDEAYLGHAPIRQAVGFFDADEARVHARALKDFVKAEKQMASAHKKLSAAELGGMMDVVAPVEVAAPESKVVKPVFGKGKGLIAASRPAPAFSEEQVKAGQAAIVADLAARRTATIATSDKSDDARELFREALQLERTLEAGGRITKDQQRWLTAYQAHPAYAAERMLWEMQGDTIFG
ncbi:transposase domain-containing protein [Cypionkella psychrotolerans]|uniref:transposase domain-containing protein n=1 Tax=Cypionkella psychrotolerans TaxID=1678131 RepID=UPI0006B4DD97|nr:transposase domain-containing protein [Cypionkella psychrotolerans]